MTVKLPYIVNSNNSRNIYSRTSMHTDNMSILVGSLRDLKPEIRNNLLIQGRSINKKTWGDLFEDPVYEFFFSRRGERNRLGTRREIAQLLVPKSLKMTDKQVRRFAKLDFKPQSLAKKYNFGVGWYPANFFVRKSQNDYSYNSLAPFIGAVNQFQIGSNTLKPGTVRMVGLRMMMDFEEHEIFVADSIINHLSSKVLDAASRIISLE